MSEKKKKQRGAWQLYEYDYKAGTIKGKNKKCPRCGKTMAMHKDPARWACGGCGYSEYLRK
jgi:small subunit ribosomal protein S27Ae